MENKNFTDNGPLIKEFKEYIGVKKIQARLALKDGQMGYEVVYNNNYTSWSPKDVFEKAYAPIGSWFIDQWIKKWADEGYESLGDEPQDCEVEQDCTP